MTKIIKEEEAEIYFKDIDFDQQYVVCRNPSSNEQCALIELGKGGYGWLEINTMKVTGCHKSEAEALNAKIEKDWDCFSYVEIDDFFSFIQGEDV